MNTNAEPAFSRGQENITDFKMNMNAKAARVLSDTLYEDKHGSIIRELCSNAFDAHKMVGKEDEPFKVTLPDAFSSMLTIRDYGPGISPEDIKTVYSTYFASTKDDNNNSVGMFGLGSKTPFSLTDAFVVTSIYKGVKRVYNAFMDSGMPRVSQFGEAEDTDEPDGLEVSITVEDKHRAAFRDALVKQLRFFPVKPEVYPQVTWPEITETLLDVDGFKYFKHNSNLLSGFFIKTGPVAYPLDFEKLEEHYRHNDMKVPKLISFMRQTAYGSYGFHRRNDKGAVLDMPIGTVEVTPSREGLSYSEFTLENIVKAIEQIKDKLFDTVKDRLHDEYKKGYAAFIEYYNNLDSMMLESINAEYVEKHFDPFVVYRGSLSIKMPEKFVGLEVKQYSSSYRRDNSELDRSWRLAWDWRHNIENCYEDAKGNVHHEAFENTGEHRAELAWLPGNDSLFFFQDENYAFAKRSYDYWMNSSASGRYYVLKVDKCDATFDDVEDFFSQFINRDMVYLSDTPKPVKSNGKGFSTTGGKKRSWFDLSRMAVHSAYDLYDRTLYKMQAPSEFDLTADDIADEDEDSYVFFTTFNNRVELPETGRNITQVVFNYIQRYLNDGTSIIAVPKNQRKKYDKMVSTIHVDDYVEKYAKEIHAALREDMNKMFLNFYNTKITRTLRSNNQFFTTVTSESEDHYINMDFDLGNWSDANQQMLYLMNEYEVDLALRELDADDLIKELADNKERWEKVNNIEDAEKLLTDLDVDFVSLKDKIDKLTKELTNKTNRVWFIKKMLRGFDGFYYGATKLPDPFNNNDDADTLFNTLELAEEMVTRLA